MRKTMRKFSDFLEDNTFDDVAPMESYLELCNEFGDDFMNFPEFEYRFYRFHNGEKDDFDSRLDSSLKAFSDLPVEILGMVVKKLQPIDRFILRFVSRNLQSIVDSYRPKLRSKHIGFRMEQNSCQIYFRPGTIELKRLENGYQVKHFLSHQTVILKNFDYREGVLNLFLMTFGHPKTIIKRFNVEIVSSIEDWIWLTENLSKSLGDLKISAKKFVFDGQKGAPLRPFLSLLKPGVLRNLVIYRSLEIQDGLYADIAEMKQWKQARRVEILSGWLKGPFPDLLHFFAHFHLFDVRLSSLTVEELIDVVKSLANSKKFQKCILQGGTQFTAEDYAAASGRTLQSRNVLRVPIEGTPDRELELRFCNDWNANLIIQRKKKKKN